MPATVGAGGVERDVTFTEAVDDAELDSALDAAYRAKYRSYPGPVARITSSDASAATIAPEPR